MKGIAIYGSTGSIGTQTLDVVSELGNMEIVALACKSRSELFAEQIKKFKPRFAAIIDERKEHELRERIGNTPTIIFSGLLKAIEICRHKDVEMVVNSAVGIYGLDPTIEFIKHGKKIGLANKESLVTAGGLVMEMARKHGVDIIPIDSEHNAILQCLRGEEVNRIKSLIITASGGPFRGYTAEMLRGVTIGQALNHPTWKMGGRITIDSATLMNKGFEIIEASLLFGVDPKNIKVVIHPQSIVHSAVEFEDGSVKAQVGFPDMRLPIQYALNYPRRLPNKLKEFDFAKAGKLEFYAPDEQPHTCLALAREALRREGTAPAVLNGADERAVELFLDGRIRFSDIPVIIRSVLDKHKTVQQPNIREIHNADMWAKKEVERYVEERDKTRSRNRSIS